MATERLNIVADCDIPYLRGVLEPYAKVTYIKGAEICADDLKGVSVLIVRTRTICNEALLRKALNLKIILTATIGFDHIDIEYCTSSGIEVKTSAGCNARGVLQWVAAVLALDAQARGWTPRGKTLGVVGVGNVGSLVAQYARLWGFNTLCCDPFRGDKDFVDIDTIYRCADIISFHVPMTFSGEHPTFEMFSGEGVSDGALILNASRGEVISPLKLRGRSLRLALDTWPGEPHLDGELLASSFVATPHVAGYSAQGKANGTAMVVRALAVRYDWESLLQWYPLGVRPSEAKEISWPMMQSLMPQYYDIASESEHLRSCSEGFEAMRNSYKLREEFF